MPKPLDGLDPKEVSSFLWFIWLMLALLVIAVTTFVIMAIIIQIKSCLRLSSDRKKSKNLESSNAKIVGFFHPSW
jgi:hypothetical protein